MIDIDANQNPSRLALWLQMLGWWTVINGGAMLNYLSSLNVSRLGISFLALIVIFFWSGNSSRAEIIIKEKISMEMIEMGCAFLVEGEISKGDAERVRSIVEEFQDGIEELEFTSGASFPLLDRMCFNSVGGSLVEGLKIARVLADLGMGSAVARNQRCESACALAFLGGSSLSMVQFMLHSTDRNRLLHPQGLLGFHAPSIGLTKDDKRLFNSIQAKGLFDVGLDAVFEVVYAASNDELLTDSLLLTILDTSSETMRYVETVGDALRWEIEVGPVGFPGGDPLFAVLNGCMNSVDSDFFINKQALVQSGATDDAFTADYLEEWKIADLINFSTELGNSHFRLSQEEITGQIGFYDFVSSRAQKLSGLSTCEFSLFAGEIRNMDGDIVFAGDRYFHGTLSDYHRKNIEPVSPGGSAVRFELLTPHYPYFLFPSAQRISDLPAVGAESLSEYLSSLYSALQSTKGEIADTASWPRPDWCPNAAADLELLICSNRDLSFMDIELNRQFAIKKQISGVRKAVAERMSLRDGCGSNVSCIMEIYVDTLNVIGQY